MPDFREGPFYKKYWNSKSLVTPPANPTFWYHSLLRRKYDPRILQHQPLGTLDSPFETF